MKNKLSGRAGTALLYLFIAAFINLFSGNVLRAQVSEEEKSQVLEKAETHLAAGEYRQAVFYYNRLLQWFPGDPGYSYAAGRCLVELGGDLDKSIDYLTFAAVNAVPYDVFYYLGKAYLGLEQYSQAGESFERFKRLATRKEVDEMKVDEYLLMCEHREDPRQATLAGTEIERKELPALLPKTSVEGEGKSDAGNEASTNPAAEHNRLVAEGLKLQSQADSLEKLHSRKLVEMRAAASPAEQNRIRAEAESVEMEMFRIRHQADARFREASLLEDGSILISENPQPGKEPGEQPGTAARDIPSVIESQTTDRFYLEDPYRKMFKRSQLDKLQDMAEVEEAGNLMMSRARESESKGADWKLRADGARNSSQQKKYLSKMKSMEEQALERKIEAVDYFQMANEEKYLLFREVLEGVEKPAGDLQEQMDMYRQRAEENYERARVLRQEAQQRKREDEKYQGLVEANAYELLTLENQKRAFEAASGKRIFETVVLAGRQTEPARSPVKAATVVPDEKKPATGETPANVREKQAELTLPVQANPVVEEKKPEQAAPENLRREEEQRVRDEIPAAAVEKATPPTGTSAVVEILYRIQVGVFSTPKEESFFRGFSPVSSEPVPGKNLTRYFIGKWQSYVEADRALAKIRQAGFGQAFMVATLNGQRVALSRARSLEKPYVRENLPAGQGEIDWKVTEGAIPVYKIQVGAFKGDPTAVMEENFRRAAGTRSVEKIRNDQGVTIYTIGNFYTFEEAVLFRNRLVTNGLKDAFVTAYLEGRRIPVEEARKLQKK